MIDKGETGKEEAFWSYWFPLGKIDSEWDNVDFIFFDRGRIHVHEIRMRRLSKEEFDALASEPRK
jgi:hypothetical protein